MQVRIMALDEPQAISPKIQVQMAERVDWVASVAALPGFERFPE